MKTLFKIILCACLLLVATAPSRAALNIQFDYTYDTSLFFSGSNASRRALLDSAANVFETRLTLENFGAMTPGGVNSWSLLFQNPTLATTGTLTNPTIAANTITIYVGARNLGGSELGLASTMGLSASGDATWINSINARNSTTNYDSLGGSIAFDTLASWYFDSDPLTLESFPGQYDFYSVAQHEIEHLLGFTTGATAFMANVDVSGTSFKGANVVSLYGGHAPLDASDDLSHWQQGLTSGGLEVLMDPSITSGQRKTATELDFAVLKDIGYNVSAVPEPAVPALLLLSALALMICRRLQQIRIARSRHSGFPTGMR